jgi:predicted phosphodiesterase
MILFIGDNHFKDHPSFLEGLRRLYKEHFIPNYKDCTLILTGDVLDSAVKVRWNLYNEIIELLKQFKSVHIVTGNHDISDTTGNCLLPLMHQGNFTVYTQPTEVTIESHTFLMLPHTTHEQMKSYEEMEGEYDYIVTHFAPPGKAWGVGEIELKKLKARQAVIYGHIHDYEIYRDRNDNFNLIIGVPQTTRNGETRRKMYGVIHPSGEYELRECPVFFDILTIPYGLIPEDKTMMYNVVDAPSIDVALDFYKDFLIRREGIQTKSLSQMLFSSAEGGLQAIKEKNKVSFEERLARVVEASKLKPDEKSLIEHYLAKVV